MPTGTTSASAFGPIPINDLATTSATLSVSLPSGAWGKIVDLQVILRLTHTFADDLDFLLVAPDGRTSFEFWSDAGGSSALVFSNPITISDSGASVLPDNGSGLLASGTYRPADYETPVETSANWGLSPSVIINHPGPSGTATLDSVFGGVPVNGTWSFYIKDDTALDIGTLDMWGLQITYNTIVKPNDFDGNFQSDILWQNSDGTPAVWNMNGMNVISSAAGPFNPGPDWHVIA